MRGGNANDVISYLEKVMYNGATNFEDLPIVKSDESKGNRTTTT